MTSTSIAFSAAIGAIWPVTRTATAPSSMICHSSKRNRPIRRTAMSRKTAARMTTEMFMGLGGGALIEPVAGRAHHIRIAFPGNRQPPNPGSCAATMERLRRFWTKRPAGANNNA